MNRKNEKSVVSSYYWPKDTNEVFMPDIADNLGLLLDKYPQISEKTRKFQHKERLQRFYSDKRQQDFFQALMRQRRSVINKIGLLHQVQTLQFRTDWRMVIGIGNESVYETSLTLHPIYGFPYIPGQAVKGVTRHAALNIILSSYEQEGINLETLSEEYAVKNHPFFRQVFGCDQEDKESQLYRSKGGVLFLDAYPITLQGLESDIMNPHYGDYYNKKVDYPADYLNPNPIPFLTVPENTEFEFVLAVKKNSGAGGVNTLELLETATGWLKEALTEQGIGAKTTVGYGYMNFCGETGSARTSN